MTRAISSISAICAAALVVQAAVAQEGSAPTTARLLPLSCFAGALKPGFASRSDVVVYDNAGGDLVTNTANPRQILDDVQLTPGPAAGAALPLLITSINLAFTVQTLGDFDLEVTFYDGITSNAGANLPVNDGTPISTFLIPIRNIPNTGGWQTGLVDLSTLPGGGVSMGDLGAFVRARFLTPGSSTLATNVTNTFATSWNTGTDWTSTRTAGRSCGGSFRDVDGDEVLEAGEFRTFNFPLQADLFMVLHASLNSTGCTADFNQDGAVDFFDYLDFVDAFSQGC